MELSNFDLTANIILLCETLLNDQNASLCNMSGYDHLSNRRKTKKGGGVSVYIRSELLYKRKLDLEVQRDNEFESIFTEVESSKHSEKNVVVGGGGSVEFWEQTAKTI